MIRIGTRGSTLARWQAEHVKSRLEALGCEASLRVITTTGDRVLAARLETAGGKGAFLKEIEEAMLVGEVDLAVHSLKDVPTALPAGLVLCAVLERADARDAVLSPGPTLAQLPAGSTIGTTSLRRQAQLRALRADLQPLDLRGNVETRIRRLREGRYDAIVLAMAGLVRLGRAGEVTEVLDPRRFIPAPGQGAIALECRADDERVRGLVSSLDHAPTARAVRAERVFLAALGGGCNLPLGAHAIEGASGLELVGFVARPDGSRIVRGETAGSDPDEVGRALAEELRRRGAQEVLRP